METIQFTYGNFRYLVFERDGRYYLLDRCPRYFIGYLFAPSNWFFYQRVHPITGSDYLSIKQRNDKFKHIAIPTSLGSGLAVLIGSWSRMNNLSFVNHFSKEVNIFLLVIIAVLSYISARLVYHSRKKSILSLLQDNLAQPVYCRIKPSKFHYKLLLAYVFIIPQLLVWTGAIYLYSKDMLLLLAFYIIFLISLLCVNISFGTEANQFYKIVDIKEN